jgi:hypothetical protein
MVFTRAIDAFFRARYTDAMVIFRAYRRELIHVLELDSDLAYRLPEKVAGIQISWEMVMSIRCAKLKLKVGEIPGDEPPRIDGVKKVHFRWGFGYVFQVLQELLSWDGSLARRRIGKSND